MRSWSSLASSDSRFPYSTTSQTKDIARVGDIKLQTTESTSHTIPPMAAGAVVILGGLLLAAGFFKKA